MAYKDVTGKDDIATLQDQYGNDAASLSRVAVDNQTPDTTAPVFQQGEANGSKITLTYVDTSQLDSENTPDKTDFSIRVDDKAVPLTDVFVNGSDKTVTLILSEPASFQQSVTVAYKDPSKTNDDKALQDEYGNDVASLPATAIVNSTPDVTPPTFIKAEVDNTQLIMRYTDAQSLDVSKLPLASAFTVRVDGNAAVVKTVSADSNTINLLLDKSVLPTQAVTVAYRDPGKGDDLNAIQDMAGNDVPSLSATPVINNTRIYTLSTGTLAFTEEPGTERTLLIYSLRLDQVPVVPVSINYATLTTGTAIPGEDFQMSSGTITFEPGQIETKVSIPVTYFSELEKPLIDRTLDVQFSGSRLTTPITVNNSLFDFGDNAMADNRIRFTTSAQDSLGIKPVAPGETLFDPNQQDTFVAEITNSLEPNATRTLSAGDYADGGKNVDTLILTATDARTDAITSVIGFELKNIETLEIRAYDADGNGKDDGEVELGLVNVSGLKTVLSTNSDANITLKTVQQLVSLDITGNGSKGSAFTLNYINDVIAGPKTTQSVILRGFGEGTSGSGNQGRVAVNGVEAFRITTKDRNSIVELDSDKLQKIDLTLEKDLTILNGKNSFVDTLKMVNVNTLKKADANLPGVLKADFSDSRIDMTVTTGKGSDDIQTGSGNDKIELKAGNNQVEANDGNDTINSGDGNDTIDAGRGFNVITAGNGNNDVITGGDNDNITTGSGNDTVDAGGSVFIDDADDSNDKDVVNTGAGDDTVILGVGDNLIDVGEGNDSVELGVNLDSADTIAGGTGFNTLKVPDIDSINDPGDFDNVSNFGTLVFTKATGGTVNADSTGVDATNLNRVGVSTYTFSKGINQDTFINGVTTPAAGDLTVNLTTGTRIAEGVAINTLTPSNLALNITNDNDGLASEVVSQLTLGNVKKLALNFQDNNLKDKDSAKIDSLNIGTLKAVNLESLKLSGNGNILIDGSVDSTTIASVVSVINADVRLNISKATKTTITTLGGNDTLVSGAGADTIDSGAGNDSITSGGGADQINAGEGNNRVAAGDGADTVTAGAGKDSIDAGDGSDKIEAGGGDDTIWAGSGVDTLSGGDGDDTFWFTYSTEVAIQGLTSADVVAGGEGNDTVAILAESADDVTLVDDIFFQWNTVETLDISKARDTAFDVDTIAGSATLNAIALRASLKNVVTGTGNDYVAIGEGFKEGKELTVEIRGGNDQIEARSAPADSQVTVYAAATAKENPKENPVSVDNLNLADTLNGGAGKEDTIRIQANNANASTNATNFEKIEIEKSDGKGDASINFTVTNAVTKSGQILKIDAADLTDVNARFTFDGSQEIDGQFSVIGGGGGDTLTGGANADTLEGGQGANSVNGGGGNDSILSGQDNDTLNGGTGNDTLNSGAGNDSLLGNEGDDILQGEAGADILIGGFGKDTLTGGAGSDQFRYTQDDLGVPNVDTISDFEAMDSIVLSGNAGASRIQPILNIEFKGNFNSFGESQGGVSEAVAGVTANDGTIEAVYQTDTNTLWVDFNEDGALNADDLQVILTGTETLSQTNFLVV